MKINIECCPRITDSGWVYHRFSGPSTDPDVLRVVIENELGEYHTLIGELESHHVAFDFITL